MKKELIKLSPFDITPDVHLIKNIGQQGYTLWQAISELIDNALDVRIEDKKPLKIEIRFGSHANNEVKWIEVRDYGQGMTDQEFEKCMKLAYVDPNKVNKAGRLGKFGLGLKTAASSLGSKFIIKTKHYQSKENKMFSLVYDEKEFLKNNSWTIIPKIEVDKDFEPGTLIRIEGLEDRGTTIYYQKVSRLIELISMEYGPLIKNGEVKIVVDTLKVRNPTIKVVAYEYQLLNNEKHTIDFALKGRKVTGWVGFLRHGHEGLSKGYFGFNLFWKNRVVGLHKKIGFRPHAETWRLVGELHLDDFPVTNNKRDFIWDHPLMETLTGPAKEDEPEGFDYKQGALYKSVERALKKFEVYKKEKRVIRAEIDKSLDEEKIPIKVARDLKKYLAEDRLPPDQIKQELNEAIEELKVAGKKQEAMNKIKEHLEEISKKPSEKKTEEELEEEFYLHGPVFEFKIKKGKKIEEYNIYHESRSLGSDSEEFIIEDHKENKILVISNKDHPVIFHSEDIEQVFNRHKVEAISIKVLRLKEEEDNVENYLRIRDNIYKKFFKQKERREELKKEEEEIEKSKEI